MDKQKSIVQLLEELAEESCKNCFWAHVYKDPPPNLRKEFDELLEEKCEQCRIKQIIEG